MAGVVAMASVIEDFDTQPCKKSRKDDGNPVVKTITNYFAPVAKPVEKPFSPPRSNNIMDYFSRRSLSSKEKSSSPEQSKENCQTSRSAEKQTSPVAVVKQPSQKRGRKAIKAARKLVEAETSSFSEDDGGRIVKGSFQSKDTASVVTSCCGVLGSDPGALLEQLCTEASVTAGLSEKSVEQAEKDDHHDNGSSCGKYVEVKPGLKNSSSPPVGPLRDQAKQVKAASRNFRKRNQQDTKQPESDPEEKEAETSLCNVSMKVNVDEALQSNNSTVTISFEDFVRSQSHKSEKGEDEQDKEKENQIMTGAEEIDTDQLENFGSEELPHNHQGSPRLVTIQAEVHVHSPKQEAVKAVGKLASIFNKRKESMSPGEVLVSPHIEGGHQSFSTSLTVKRKSNVVLQEEDLELAVLETESTPKCTEAERKQFMAAFKQPSLDGAKTKPGKTQTKQKQPGEKNSDANDKVVEEDTVISISVEQIPAPSQETNIAEKKQARRSRKNAKEANLAVTSPAHTPAEETAATVVDVDIKKEEPSVPALRRSRRGTVVRQAIEITPERLVRKPREQKESKNVPNAAAALPEIPVKMSTPKPRKSKHGVFVAEMVCPPDTKESPIRIKFIRLQKNVPVLKTESGSTISNMALKTSKESKKRKQAKKLVERAKVIQQSKKSAAKEKGTLRRSSRNEATIKKSYCEDEDSVICLEDDKTPTRQATPAKGKSQKALRSLNDVLGRATSAGKETKATPGSKAALLGQEKVARKVTAVVSIFDESNHEGSENPQDNEQFRARREFLKSGLPESFRKQIAKTAANKEAYSLSCSSFQPVIHMKQPPNNCPLWCLSWPESPLLYHLKELGSRTSSSFPPVSTSFGFKTEPARRAFPERGSSWRVEISESVRQLLMEEVGDSNPPFPGQRFLSRFLKRRIDHQQHSTVSEPEATRVTSTSLPAEPAGGKRKRMDDEGEKTAKVAKKQRGSRSEGKAYTADPEPAERGGRTRRTQRSKLEEEHNETVEPCNKSASSPSEHNLMVVLDDLLLEENGVKNDLVKEDVLWTDKYQPQHSSDILGNTASVRRLHSWLKEWKLRADREERKKQKDKKQAEGGNDSDWDCGEEDSQDGEDMLCNTMLITGPTGVGKTAAVYACAQELGFKVFEVNASSQRSGRLILSQLREATQSHQVDSQGVNAHKPAYFNSYGTSSSPGAARPGSSPRKINSPRRVVSSPRKNPQSPRGAKKGSLAPTSLANFFKMGQPTNKTPLPAKKNEQTATSKKVMNTNSKGHNKHKDPTSPTESSEEQNKKTATSLILFEEVDVIFDDDTGFLAAIKTFMTTTKRPVILTTSDPAFSSMFDGHFEEIHFTTPSALNVSSYLQLLCLAEDMRTDLLDISSLLRLNSCDIRQSLMQLQFWTRSAGGRHIARALKNAHQNAELKPEADGHAAERSACAVTVPSTLPPCDIGCTESKLGLMNIEPERDIWELLKSQSLEDEALCRELLTESRRRGVDLLYSNMERLLPLPLKQLTTSNCRPESQDHGSVNPKELPSSSCLQSDTLPPPARLQHTVDSADYSDDGSPIKVSSRMREYKKKHCLPDNDRLNSDSDSEENFLSLCKPQVSPRVKEEVKERPTLNIVRRKPLTHEERVKSLPVSQCLESMAEFLDNMSYVDSSLTFYPEKGVIQRSPVSAVVKDGMTDELKTETIRDGWLGGEYISEIQAAVEFLSFRKCRISTAEAWDKAQQLEGELGKEATAELTLPVAPHCEGYSFIQDGPCHPQLVQERKEVMTSLMQRGAVGTLGNTSAVALDYLPALRTICRSEHLKEQGKMKRRFLHYLDGIHLGLQKSTLQHLAEDFP
ncbi:ATPase family AAA domain-containing protein 5 isoform X2 [Echeneis naucrates]|uniref:ATPase family AAA domain-containing protein 5 isoform X2 n=1 Tax=Echeneis naucrates TaxID=173247 RepID=UPI001113F3BE|nr:ATPase family AAA domain-containing protein 5-like isoform X2 [Echeneis naucrates]